MLRLLCLPQARPLLAAGRVGSGAAVADAGGFASAEPFSTFYAERFGHRPSDYRVAGE